MKNKLYIIGTRIAGIAGCLLDLIIQVGLSAAAMFRKDPEFDDSENFYHK